MIDKNQKIGCGCGEQVKTVNIRGLEFCIDQLASRTRTMCFLNWG